MNILEPYGPFEQIAASKHPSLCIIAPAGCGKTECLALRARGLITSGSLLPYQQILAVTFTNKARDNLESRLARYLNLAQRTHLVHVTNFHGLSARIIRNHGRTIGVWEDVSFPVSDWVAEQCDLRGMSYREKIRISDSLGTIKRRPFDDEEVERELRLLGDESALAIELERRRRHVLTYDDLPRLAQLILRNDLVAELYEQRFGSVLVDEFQDLTPQQFEIVERIGKGRLTFAGDLSQGIYRFAGAQPEEVIRKVEEAGFPKIELNESWRSSPAVLSMVNSLSSLTGAKELIPKDPGSWPHGGLGGVAFFSSSATEANWVVGFCKVIMSHAPKHRIGILVRSRKRRADIDEAMSHHSHFDSFRWDDDVVDPEVGRVLRREVSVFVGRELPAGAVSQIDEAAVEMPLDLETRRDLHEAIIRCNARLRDGEAPEEVLESIKIGSRETILEKPGVHLLTGHAGKGQQFDWVVVVGAEEGSIPHYRANSKEDVLDEAKILSVMVSRARHGVVVTASQFVGGRQQCSSRFIRNLLGCEPAGILLKKNELTQTDEIQNWLSSANWEAISAR